MSGISLPESLGVIAPPLSRSCLARASQRVGPYPADDLLPVLLGGNADPTLFDVGDRHRSAGLQRGRRTLPCLNVDPLGGYQPVARFERDILTARRLPR